MQFNPLTPPLILRVIIVDKSNIPINENLFFSFATTKQFYTTLVVVQQNEPVK